MSGYWNEFLATGIAEMDERYKTLFDKVTVYTHSIAEGNVDASVRTLFEYLHGFIQTQFVEEERLLETMNYRDVNIHKAQHDYFRNKFYDMNNLIQRKSATPEMTREIHQNLVDWLVRHVMGSDVTWIRILKYGEGVTPSLNVGLCPKCGSAVRGGKFCGKCGQQLTVAKCHACGELVGSNDEFCTNCGASLKPKHCMRCGAENNPDAAFCAKCGSPLGPFPENSNS